MAAREQQHQILRQQKEYWKGQARSDNGHRKADAMEVRRLCRSILGEYSSTTKVNEIAEGVQWLANQWADPRGDAGYTAMADYATELAREILEGSEVDVNESVADTYAELKDFLRRRYIRMDEGTLADFPDFGDFKKRNRALHFRTDGTGEGVDTLWLELQDEFGKGMFPDDVMAASDQINHIADTLAGMAPDMQNPFQAQMELTVQQLANDLLWRTSQLTPEKMTRAVFCLWEAADIWENQTDYCEYCKTFRQ